MLANYLLHEIGVPDEETLDGTRAVHIAFGHRNVELVEQFLSLENGNEIKERAKSMALDLLGDDEAKGDNDCKPLIQFIKKQRMKQRWNPKGNSGCDRLKVDKSQYKRYSSNYYL